ncbi:hypothetical protein C1H71_13210 [Iodobacter fluviatilis]|uniref:Uncharacterized protein n=1 Tax=Iodobacter fluviatilis TaxID=537 RepID=A0A7G3GBE9_9NEIS|nr:hypothetical protein C1H71_13210 [Iodobacter fluviatilis]
MSEASSAAAARLFAERGFALVGAAFFGFVSWPFKKGRPPRWLPLQNQRAEGTQKVLLILLSTHWMKPAELCDEIRKKAVAPALQK